MMYPEKSDLMKEEQAASPFQDNLKSVSGALSSNNTSTSNEQAVSSQPAIP